MEEAAKREHRGRGARPARTPSTAGRSRGRWWTRTSLGFIAYFPMPIRHGLTLGELAQLFKGRTRSPLNLTVVPMKHWTRGTWFDETGLPWVNPSPNMRNLIQATLYPGIGAIEWANISVGRGTDTPFEHIGAPWIDGVALAAALNARQLAGIRFYPVSFTPDLEQVQGRAVPGRVHDRHRPRRAAAGARGARDPVGAQPAARRIGWTSARPNSCSGPGAAGGACARASHPERLAAAGRRARRGGGCFARSILLYRG